MEPIQFLDAVSGYTRTEATSSADKPIKLARIDPAYDAFGGSYPDTVAPAKVTFEGEGTLSGKLYPVATGYIPSPGARVWMVPIGTTYMIAGGAASYAAQGFYAKPDGSQIGVEFGEGNYWDSLVGLLLDTDAEIGGDLSIGPRGIRVPEMRWGSASLTGPGAGTSITSVVPFSPAFPAGTTVFAVTQIQGAAGGTSFSMSRASTSATQITVQILKTDAARANYIGVDTFNVHWLAWAVPSS